MFKQLAGLSKVMKAVFHLAQFAPVVVHLHERLLMLLISLWTAGIGVSISLKRHNRRAFFQIQMNLIVWVNRNSRKTCKKKKNQDFRFKAVFRAFYFWWKCRLSTGVRWRMSEILISGEVETKQVTPRMLRNWASLLESFTGKWISLLHLPCRITYF